MLDGRRHSVDLPLSRTLVALRRVRSLRDPSTNSITKSSALVDNLTWDAASCYGISLELGNDHQGQEDGLSNHSPPLRSRRSFGLEERSEEFASDPELESSTKKKTTYKSKKLSRIGKRGSNSMRPKHIEDSIYNKTIGGGGGVHGDKSLFSQRLDSSDHDDRALDMMICVQPPVDNSIRPKHFEEEEEEDSAYSRVNGAAGIYGDKSFSQKRHDTDHERAMDLICVQPSDNHLEDFDSYSEPTLGSARYEKVASIVRKRKSAGCKKQMKPSRVVGDAGSDASSPYPSLSDGRLDGSSLSLSMFANEELDLEDPNHRGCGISCCWSRTPRYRESDLPTDGEDNPLLSGEVAEMGLSEQELSCTYVKSETTPYSDSPRSLSHKFRPKFFSDLVGQHVVARSLLNAISRGKLTSFYLFHGPRGTGKTSAARIFAAALNCLSLQEHGPCGSCRECILFFSGRSRDVKEVDPAKTNRTDRVRSLLKDAARPPVSSRYKAFIIDECQLLRGETWTTVLSSIDVLPRHVVFVMITADLDNLPRSALSRCQRYHFPKINDVDIVGRLTKICVEECLDFDEAALGFIAAKSSGSLRDAEMMLDQLSLLGKKVTISSAHELIGIVSDDELLDLLDLAFSSDTSRTVRRARDLMRSRVDPMQLISQLANLIMDMLSGRWQTGSSEAGRNFFRNTSEMDLQKLKHALKILSDAEKQLRTSKNQTTWLTVALLQLSSVESFPLDGNDSRAFPGTEQPRDDSFCGACLSGQSVSCSCHDNKSQSSEIHPDSKGKLEIIWRRALEKCQSNTLRSFLQKEGKLSSVCVNQGLAVAEVEFRRPDYVSKAEKSWKSIANSLQIVLGCNVEIRLGLVPSAYSTKNSKVNKPSCGLLRCSRRMHSTSEDDHSDSSDFTSRRSMERGRPVETCSSDPGPHISPVCSHRKEVSTTIRNSEGNALSTGTTVSLRSVQDDPLIGSQMRFDSSKEELENQECENQPSCFSKTLRFRRRSRSSSSDASQAICLRIQPRNKLELSIPHKAALENYFCANDPYILCPNSNTVSNISVDEARLENETTKDPKVHCWRTPKIPLRKKAWQLRPQHQRSSPLVGWLLPCATAK